VADTTVERRRRQLAGEVAHWRAAAHSLGDLDTIAAPAAWAAVERYLDSRIRQRLTGIATSVSGEADQLAAAAAGAHSDEAVAHLRLRLLRLRRRYLRAETVIDFYCEAINTRTTPRLGRILRGLDSVAVDSMAATLRPLGIEAPPVLTYLDKGLGAAILRAGVRLWDDNALSPAAAIKITRHNLLRPTSLIHESGHQVAHLCGWNEELGRLLHDAVQPYSPEAASTWQRWASEVAADVYAFAVLGYAPVPALANVVDGSTDHVFTILPGDPHPFAWLRVLFNVALCRNWFGPGPWDDLAQVWQERHLVDHAPPDAREVSTVSLPLLDQLAELCTRAPMHAFGRRPLAALADPRRVSPHRLSELAERAGASLYTSTYLERHESLRIVAWNTLQAAQFPELAPTLAGQLQGWLEQLGRAPLAAAA
jgi:hypothetical protein